MKHIKKKQLVYKKNQKFIDKLNFNDLKHNPKDVKQYAENIMHHYADEDHREVRKKGCKEGNVLDCKKLNRLLVRICKATLNLNNVKNYRIIIDSLLEHCKKNKRVVCLFTTTSKLDLIIKFITDIGYISSLDKIYTGKSSFYIIYLAYNEANVPKRRGIRDYKIGPLQQEVTAKELTKIVANPRLDFIVLTKKRGYITGKEALRYGKSYRIIYRFSSKSTDLY